MPHYSDILTNKTLSRIIKRYLGKDFVIPEEYIKLFTTVNEQFNHQDNDRLLIERTMDISGQELRQANEKLRAESEQSKLILKKLRESLSALNEYDESFLDADIVTVADILRTQIERRILAEQKADLLHAYSQQIIDTSIDAVICSDEFGFITDWNKTAEGLFGWKKKEVIGLKLVETVIPKRFAPIVARAIDTYRNKRETYLIGKPLELTAVNKDGDVFPIELSISAICTEKGYLFTSFVRDISERKKSESQLIEAKLAAESANRAKSAFLSSMSHELRTPLNAVIGFSQLLMKDSDIPSNKREYIEMMYNSANHLLDMINDVLDISKIEAGKMELSFDAMDVESILNETKTTFGSRCKSKGINFEILCESNVPRFLYGDAKRLRQILFNIVGNAVKFTNHGSIAITVSLDGYTKTDKPIIRFKISDTGRGIPQEQIKTIFEPFKQVTGMHSEGTGLGLAICKKIVMLMDGEIGLQSEVGKGSTFTIIVPLSVATIHKSDSNENSLLTYKLQHDRSYKVIIADDIENNRALLNLSLSQIGFTCFEAVNGKQAVELFVEHKADLMILDIQMPIMNGVDAMKQIRTLPEGATVPIIAVSASGFGYLRDNLLRDGFNAYIRKPFREQQLLDTIEQVSTITFERSIEYLEKTSEEQYNANKVLNIVRFIQSLPAEKQQELIQAIEVQNFSEVQDIVSTLGDISSEYQPAVTNLLHIVETYDYSLLIELTNQLLT
ncbi:MAG: ATP-binding protein [Candidatus Kapaibacterium sp.]|nr:response regulator [Bacteroidota bacterium]